MSLPRPQAACSMGAVQRPPSLRSGGPTRTPTRSRWAKCSGCVSQLPWKSAVPNCRLSAFLLHQAMGTPLTWSVSAPAHGTVDLAQGWMGMQTDPDLARTAIARRGVSLGPGLSVTGQLRAADGARGGGLEKKAL